MSRPQWLPGQGRTCFYKFQTNYLSNCVCENPFAYLDSSTPAFTNSIRHSSTRRVNHGHESDEAQVLSGEVHFISIKSKSLWELVIRQVILAET
uniref:Uncharacterized protein n=2 Tax=Oreochromis TaxID=8139 RepID=A0A669D9C4_ORENI